MTNRDLKNNQHKNLLRREICIQLGMYIRVVPNTDLTQTSFEIKYFRDVLKTEKVSNK